MFADNDHMPMWQTDYGKWNNENKLGTDRLSVIFHAIKTDEFSIKQKWGVITLLGKKKNDRHFLKILRPILITDYKTIAKLLAKII